MDKQAIGDIRLARNQNQPVDNGRSLDEIERVTGQRHEARPRGRPRIEATEVLPPRGQGEPGLG